MAVVQVLNVMDQEHQLVVWFWRIVIKHLQEIIQSLLLLLNQEIIIQQILPVVILVMDLDLLLLVEVVLNLHNLILEML